MILRSTVAFRQFAAPLDGRFRTALCALDQLLGLVDGELAVDHLMQYREVTFHIVNTRQRTCMGHADQFLAEGQLGLGRQGEKTQVVGDGGTVFTHLLAQLFVRQTALFNQRAVGQSHLHGAEFGALDVLHQRHLHHLVVGGGAEIGGYFFEAGHARGLEAALTGY